MAVSVVLLAFIAATFALAGIRVSRGHSVVFSADWSRRYRGLAAAQLAEFGDRRLVVLAPSPIATASICNHWPFALTPSGILLAANEPHGAQLVPYGELQSATILEGDLRFYGEPLEDRSSRRMQRWKEQIDSITHTGIEDRPAAIRTMLRSWNDLSAIRKRADEFFEQSRVVRRRCIYLYLLSFVFGPALIFLPIPTPELAMLLAVYLTAFFYSWPMIVRAFASAHRDLYGDSPAGIASLFLSPGVAIRAYAMLGERVFEEFSPLAAACVLCPPAAARSVARRYLLDLQHAELDDAADPAVRSAWTWLRDEILVVSAEPLQAMGWSAADLVRYPEPEEDARSYCPRCDRQFRLESGECHACHIPLLAFPQGASGVPTNNL